MKWLKEDWKQPIIKEGEDTEWGWRVRHVQGLKLGKNVDIGYGVYIQCEAGVTIEDDVQIGGGTKIYSVNSIDGTRGHITLKHGCKIGANSVILPGVIIGVNAKVGALSVVKNDVPDGATICGVWTKKKGD
jgi:serine O-acetyltransferase